MVVAPSDAQSITPSSEKSDPKETQDPVPVDNSYQIKPSLEVKFKEIPVKEIIRNVVSSLLTGKVYEPENVKKWTIAIANEINDKVKDLEMKRYKHIVQVILGEKKGAGVKSGVRCLWDSDVDSFTSEIFMNDTIFCVTTVFAVYLY
ncbi:dynein light chain Tctex-type protein 2B [Leptinotarsa decemlineata]|uniref:dynein light chain Tctex-type protein 2B n=1 Tax=Leptinotarsa decemlineata TaxID=7539 RepID=UPI000C252FD2|nr:tctex1 domain-containing protein 2-like [Leptinotarsa decemlineata]